MTKRIEELNGEVLQIIDECVYICDSVAEEILKYGEELMALLDKAEEIQK